MTEKFNILFDFAPKSTVKAGEGLEEGNFSFYTSSPIVSKRIDKAQYYNDALIFGTGGSASIHFAGEPFATSTDCIVATAKNEGINAKFVYYYLFGNIHILERGFKGAGLKHISKKYIQNLDIPIFPIETQNKIVTILDKASELIKKRDQSLDLLKENLNAAFLQMFGQNNPLFESWGEMEIQTLAKPQKGSMRTGPFGSSLKHEEFEEEGEVAVLGIDNAVENVFKWKKKRFISKEKYEKFKNYTVYPRDVIITIMGTVGRSAVIPDDIPTAINTKHLAAITLDERKCNPYYLAYSIHSNPYVAFQMKSRNRGAIMDGLNLGIIKGLKLKAAPIDLQNEFEQIYLATQRHSDRLYASKKELDDFMNSLYQKAFKGELNFNIDVELDTLVRNIDLQKKKNDLSKIVGDEVYLQRLVDKLNEREFKEKDLYDKAKHGMFQLLKEDDRVNQVYNAKNKSMKLALK